MILLNENNQKYTLFNVSTHFCECAAVQSGHLKSPARTRVNLCKIIFPKNKATIINLMTVVIQYAYAYSNLKNQDFWCGHLRTDQDSCVCILRSQYVSQVTNMKKFVKFEDLRYLEGQYTYTSGISK